MLAFGRQHCLDTAVYPDIAASFKYAIIIIIKCITGINWKIVST
jgi:hypothetical protein